MRFRKAAILGAGSWGTALANLLASKELMRVELWTRRVEHAKAMREMRENELYLPSIRLHSSLHVTDSLQDALEGSDFCVFAIPSHGVRHVIASAAPHLPEQATLLAAIKGIEEDSLATVSEIFESALPDANGRQLCFLGGPSFAKEVAQQFPTAVLVASKNHDVARDAQQTLSAPRLRCYTTDDVMGVEIGGALKNVIAIATGISDGLGFGLNTRAALITRGLHEMTRLGRALGAQPTTLYGLAGMGDLVLTCTGELSRNRTVGVRLGRGEALDEVLDGMHMVAEGVRTVRSALQLAERHSVEMPIVREVHDILYCAKPPDRAVEDLMGRPLKRELE